MSTVVRKRSEIPICLSHVSVPKPMMMMPQTP